MEIVNRISFVETFPHSVKQKFRISGIITVRNAVKLGYPFLEAILHILPAVDEFLIGEGGSTDETPKYLEKLRKTFPKKILLFYTPWEKSQHWESFDRAIDALIVNAKGTWIWEIQGDEFWHEKDLLRIVDIMRKADADGYNSIRQPCVQYGFIHKDSYKYRNIRMLRKIPKLISHWGGDDFQIGDSVSPRKGLTSHNVPPELDREDIELMHFSRLFPRNRLEQDKINVEFIGQGKAGGRQESYEASLRRDRNQMELPNPDEVLDCIPALLQGLSQELRYRIREELFDINWLEKITGLNYRDCQRCGKCCIFLDVSLRKTEIQSKKYQMKLDRFGNMILQKKRIFIEELDKFENVCIYYNEKRKTCEIYDERPLGCHSFFCDDDWLRKQSK